jgi:thymidylate kinase
MDYWEAGRDLHPHLDTYDSFIAYQTDLLQEFDKLAVEFAFKTIDARMPAGKVQEILREHVAAIVKQPDAAGDDSTAIRVEGLLKK